MRPEPRRDQRDGDGRARAVSSRRPVAGVASFDCFYVYPTVSNEPGDNADLAVQPAETAPRRPRRRSSRGCATSGRRCTGRRPRSALQSGDGRSPSRYRHRLRQPARRMEGLPRPRQPRPADRLHRALAGCRHADPVVATRSTPRRRLRKQMVSAIILGGNVQVPVGRTSAGASGTSRRARRATQTGCVIAYSTFAVAAAGRLALRPAGPGREPAVAADDQTGQQVACVNPVTFSSQSGGLQPLLPAGDVPVAGVAR